MASLDRAKTKIVATIGPASSSATIIEKLIRAGVDVIRLNFSHGSHDSHGKNIATIKRLREKLDRPVAIMADLSGPKMRLGKIEPSSMALARGAEVALIAAAGSQRPGEIPFPNRTVLKGVKADHSILLQDGNIQLKAIRNEGEGRRIVCRVVNGGRLSSGQGIFFPVSAAHIPAITKKDRADIRFAVSQGVDYFAISFVKSEKDVELARKAVRETGGSQHLIAKIEKPEAVAAIEKIIAVADAIMVARGDLGVEIPLDEVPHVQKRIIRLCNDRAKPVITATQMLESMTERPRPTRAEVTDVANAILDGTDAVMLSGETAAGKFPVQAVQMMSRIIASTEKNLTYWTRVRDRMEQAGELEQRSVSRAACVLAFELDLRAIVCSTMSGSTARMVSAYRPRVPVCALTLCAETYYHLALSWGVTPLMVRRKKTVKEESLFEQGMDWLVKRAVQTIQESGVLKRCENIVIVGGAPLMTPGTTNFLRVVNACPLPEKK